MSNTYTEEFSSYVQYLPGIYQADAEKGGFVGKYLKIFEKILSGIGEADDRIQVNGKLEGIEQIIDRIYEFFDPDLAPSDTSQFLKWLAEWVALNVRDDWEDLPARRLLKRIVSLYKKRGTKDGLSEYLKIFVGPGVEIAEYIEGIIIGKTGIIGKDTFVGGSLPHFFMVTTIFSTISGLGLTEKPLIETVNIIRSILDLEKPAHTYYALRFIFPEIIVGVRSTVGDDTIIGSKYPIFV